MATTFNTLMQHLGYREYVAQGGDWGSLIVRRAAQMYPTNCKAIHLNLLLVTGPPQMNQVCLFPTGGGGGGVVERGLTVGIRTVVAMGYGGGAGVVV